MFSLASAVFLGSYIQDSLADVISPKKQMNLGIAADDIVCDEGAFKVAKKADGSIACIKPNNVAKLVSLGWAKPVDQKELGLVLNKESIPLGTIKNLYLQPTITNFGKISPKSPISGYDFTFEICASAQKIYVPDILVKSDSETQRYEIPENIEPNQCVLSSTFIRASDPNTIRATLQNKGDISSAIAEMESKVASIREELNMARKSLGDKSSPNTAQASKIIDLRKQLNDASEDLYRLYFVVYASPKEKYTIERLSFTGAALEGELANVVGVKKSVSSENSYDVIFEACAGKTQVIPIVVLNINRPGAIARAIAGERVGTLVR